MVQAQSMQSIKRPPIRPVFQQNMQDSGLPVVKSPAPYQDEYEDYGDESENDGAQYSDDYQDGFQGRIINNNIAEQR